MEMLVDLREELVVMAINNSRLYIKWNPEIVQAEIKLSISSENSAIVYQKHREYSQWYRERDFVFLRHLFKIGKDYFIADKSIENTNYIPYSTIHRAHLTHQIMKVSPTNTGCKLTIDCHMDHGGLLNR